MGPCDTDTFNPWDPSGESADPPDTDEPPPEESDCPAESSFRAYARHSYRSRQPVSPPSRCRR